MCLGVPGLIVERSPPTEDLPFGVVEFAGIQRRVCLACVPDAVPGDYVIVHVGIAISRIDHAEAQRVFAFLHESGEGDAWAEGASP
jgi:hydrogenase expression/formation protein HypC